MPGPAAAETGEYVNSSARNRSKILHLGLVSGAAEAWHINCNSLWTGERLLRTRIEGFQHLTPVSGSFVIGRPAPGLRTLLM